MSDDEAEPTFEKFNPIGIMKLADRKKKQRDKKYARFNRRMMAATVDSLVLVLFMPLIDWLAPLHTNAVAGVAYDPTDPEIGQHLLMQVLGNTDFMLSWCWNLVVQIAVFCAYSAACWHFWSATPGKIIMRIKIADAQTELPISDRQIAIRCAGYLVSGFVLFLGFFWIGIDKRRRGWHDMMADTVVLTIPWRKREEIEPVTVNRF